MKTETVTNSNIRRFTNLCRNSCRKALARIRKVRQDIAAEYSRTFPGNERLLRLSLNEAEALAWQTDFPLLVFPTLASEKVQAVARWQHRQESLRRTNSVQPFAA